MKFLAVAALLFAGSSLAVPSQAGKSPCVPGGTKPGNNHPGGNQPSGNQPGGNNPSGNNPGGNQPGGNQPGGNNPGGNQPGGNQPGGNQPGGNNPGGDNPSGNQPGGNNPGGNNPGGNNPGGDNPSGNNPGPDNDYYACPRGLFSQAQCCDVDVLGLLGLDCETPNQLPTSADSFRGNCATIGKQARCCVLPVAGQDVLCTKPIGIY